MLRNMIARLEAAVEISGEGTPLTAIDGLEETIRELKAIEDALSPKHAFWNPSFKTVAVDFDGVIHSDLSGWKGPAVINDPPLPGAIEWLDRMVQHFNVIIFSVRCNDVAGIAAMVQWLKNWDLPDETLRALHFEPGKPSAHCFIDDRAIQFQGDHWAVAPVNLMQFRPWFAKHPEWKR